MTEDTQCVDYYLFELTLSAYDCAQMELVANVLFLASPLKQQPEGCTGKNCQAWSSADWPGAGGRRIYNQANVQAACIAELQLQIVISRTRTTTTTTTTTTTFSHASLPAVRSGAGSRVRPWLPRYRSLLHVLHLRVCINSWRSSRHWSTNLTICA